MTTQEFQKLFAGKVVYNSYDLLNDSKRAKEVRKIASFWNSMKKAGATTKALNDEFSAIRKKFDKEGHFNEVNGLINLLETVIENHGCFLATEKYSHDETIVEREVFSQEITDMLWEDREYNNLIC